MPIPASDRAFNYGDGVFTTMCICNGRAELLSFHLSRLLHDATAIGLVIDTSAIKNAILKEIANNSPESGSLDEKYVLKIHVSGGEGGRGYSRNEQNPPVVRLTKHEYPSHYNVLYSTGLKLICAQTTLAIQPILAGVKHVNRLEQVLIKREVSLANVDDAIVCDTQGNVIESSAGNIFFFTNNMWCTPSLHGCGVNGVVRQCLLEAFEKNNIPYEIGQFTTDEIKCAECVVVTNALMKVMPVKSIRFDNDQSTSFPVMAEQIQSISDLLSSRLQQLSYDLGEVESARQGFATSLEKEIR